MKDFRLFLLNILVDIVGLDFISAKERLNVFYNMINVHCKPDFFQDILLVKRNFSQDRYLLVPKVKNCQCWIVVRICA